MRTMIACLLLAAFGEVGMATLRCFSPYSYPIYEKVGKAHTCVRDLNLIEWDCCGRIIILFALNINFAVLLLPDATKCCKNFICVGKNVIRARLPEVRDIFLLLSNL